MGFATETSARSVIRYTDRWDQDNIIQREYKQIKRETAEESFEEVPTPELRLKIEEFVEKNGNLRQQDLVAQIWALIFGSRKETTTVSPAGTTKTTTTVSTTTDPSMATLAGRTRRTTRYKIRGYCQNPPKRILPENDTREAPSK